MVGGDESSVSVLGSDTGVEMCKTGAQETRSTVGYRFRQQHHMGGN